MPSFFRTYVQWYDRGKIGIFVHMGVFSVPGVGDAWFWFLWKTPTPRLHSEAVQRYAKHYLSPKAEYADFAKDFTQVT